MEHYSIPFVHNTFNSIIVSYIFSVSYYTDPDIRMSYGTFDSTVISPITTEAHDLNTVNASAAQRDDSSPAPKNRHLYLSLIGTSPTFSFISW